MTMAGPKEKRASDATNAEPEVEKSDESDLSGRFQRRGMKGAIETNRWEEDKRVSYAAKKSFRP